MEKDPSEVPLQEVVYKPTTQDGSQLVPEQESKAGFLFLATAVANLMAFTAGIAFGWSSPVLPKLSGKVDPANNPLGRPATPSEDSWIAGILCLGAFFGPLAAGRVADKIGPKRTLIFVAIPMAAAFVVIAYAKTILLFFICRFLMGFGAGSVFTVLPMYVGAIAEDHNRGTLGCFMGMFVAFGFLFAFSVGPYLTVKNFSLICVLPLLLFVPVFSFFIPESPHFLASVGDQKSLEASLLKLRQRGKDQVRKEATDIINEVEEIAQNQSGIKELFQSRGLRRGVVVTLGIITLQQCAGINAVLSYMQTIFDATGSQMPPEISTIIIGIVQAVATILTSSLVDRLGRRVLLLFSVIGACFSLIALGLYFYLKIHQFDVSGISWLPVSSLVVYIVAFNIGLGPLPWAIMAELFPPSVRSIAASLTCFTCFVVSFIITLFFPMVSLTLGMAWSFWIFALVCFSGSVFIYFTLPETKGKSLQEIQRLLDGSK